MDRVWVVISFPDDLVQLKEQLLKPDPNERKPQGQARPNVLFGAGLGWRRAGVRQDGAGQACWPYLSVTAAATNVLRPALPGLVAWAAHQSRNVVGSM
jgi:hypothetical protein